MPAAKKESYLKPLTDQLNKLWPDNRTINLVFHGHSVPSGYFRTPHVDTLNAYPHLTLAALREKFPFSVINVIVTAVGGENSEQGAGRFEKEVLNHKPDLLFIDYGLNDRRLGLARAKAAWKKMIEAALKRKIKIILLTPTLDTTVSLKNYRTHELVKHTRQIEKLAEHYGLGLADSFNASLNYCLTNKKGVNTLLSQSNHPNRQGHRIVADEIIDWFPMHL